MICAEVRAGYRFGNGHTRSKAIPGLSDLNRVSLYRCRFGSYSPLIRKIHTGYAAREFLHMMARNAISPFDRIGSRRGNA